MLLRTQAPARLLTEHRRYRLQLDPSLIDYYRFRELAATGQRAFRAGDRSSAATTLAEADHLWQGQPLADLHSAWAQRTADSLTRQELLPVYHSLLAAQLELGQAEHVLERSRDLLVTYETDLTLSELQMRALAEVNGRSSIVSYFYDVTEKLREVLRIDPTERLVQVYRRLIEQPGTSDVNQQSTQVGERRPPVFQAPRDIPQFIGREAILRELDARLTTAQTAAVVTLDGAPGVGKTAVATYWAHRRRDRFPDGVLHVDLNGYGPGHPVAPATALATFLTAFGFSMDQLPDDLAGRTALLQPELCNRNMLIILDNAYDSAHVRPLLAATAPCPVLITSRQKLSLLAYNDGAYTITVPTLMLDESIALLARGIRHTHVQQDVATLHSLAVLCGGLPFALRVVGEHAAVRADVPLPELLEHLQRRHLLDIGSHGDRESRTLRAAFDLSVDKFPQNIARFFALLGLYPATDVTIEVAAAITGSSIAETEHAFDVLVGAHLVQQLTADSYHMHDLFHLYAEDRARRLEVPGEQQEAVHRMVDWYLYSGLNAVRVLWPQLPTVPPLEETVRITPRTFDDADDARRWFLSARRQVIAVGQSASDRGMHSHLWRLVGTYSGLLNTYCDPSEIIDVHRRAVVSAQIEGARDGESGNLNNLGVIEFRRGEYESAARYFTQALAIHREIDAEYGESVCLGNLANTFLERGQARRAIDLHQQSLAIAKRLGDTPGQASVYHRLGDAYFRTDQPAAADKYYQRALRLRSELGDLRGQAVTLTKLGELNLANDRPQAAVDYCDRAIELSRKVLDNRRTAEALRVGASSYLKLRDFTHAVSWARYSARLCNGLNDFPSEADAHDVAGQAAQAIGHFTDAHRSWSVALSLYEKLGSQKTADIRAKLRRLDEIVDEMPTQRTVRRRRKRLVPMRNQPSPREPS